MLIARCSGPQVKLGKCRNEVDDFLASCGSQNELTPLRQLGCSLKILDREWGWRTCKGGDCDQHRCEETCRVPRIRAKRSLAPATTKFTIHQVHKATKAQRNLSDATPLQPCAPPFAADRSAGPEVLSVWSRVLASMSRSHIAKLQGIKSKAQHSTMLQDARKEAGQGRKGPHCLIGHVPVSFCVSC